ncbi:AraC family transcriptional regulator [Streptomyces sp. NPDC038707]|uniref:AraC family transcriptional regulator n=1 Tax=unclassified Streptomyces TaxID=2593676 RepID=UPI0033D66A0D
MPETHQRTAPGRALHISTRDLAEAREQGSRNFARHEMRLAPGHRLDFRLDIAAAPHVTVGRLSYGADAKLTVPPMRLCYHVNLPLSGGSAAEQNGTRGESAAGRTGTAFVPDAPLRVRWSPDARQYVLRFPRELLEGHAAKLAGLRSPEEVRFDLVFDLSGGTGQALVATAGFLFTELARPGGIAVMPAACRELEAALMTQLLMAVPHQLSPVLHGSPRPTRGSKVREVMDFIDEHPAAATSTADLAALAGVSARALQLGFREVAGVSPGVYLRNVRLDRAHAELSCGTGGSVTEIAARWGFYHPSRFARQYRERFGVLPSETVRGTRP